MTKKTSKFSAVNQGGYLNNISFLIVEDNEFMRSIIRQVLFALGARDVREASDGSAALVRLQVFKPDIILLDWEMAPLDGVEFTKIVRTSPDSVNPFVPIIMISGYGEYWRLSAARNAGVTEFLVKPISAKGLFSRIRAVIERPRPFVRVGHYFGPDRRRKDHSITDERRKDWLTSIAPDDALKQSDINALFNPDAPPEE